MHKYHIGFHFSTLKLKRVTSLKNTHLYAVVVIALISIAGIGIYFASNIPSNTNVKGLTIIGANNVKKTFYLGNLLSMNATTGTTMAETKINTWSASGTYTGVLIKDLVGLVGGMVPGDLLEVTASDNYTGYLSYDNVYPQNETLKIQGQFILAYSCNGTQVPTWEDGYRLVCLPEDGNYSNSDYFATVIPELKRSSASAIWICGVVSLKIIRSNTLNVTISQSYILNEELVKMMPSVSGTGCYLKTTGAIVGPNNYTGVPVTYLLSRVGFNFEMNFSLRFIASDGYEMTFNKSQVLGRVMTYYDNGTEAGVKNLTMILAYAENGESLGDAGLYRVAYIGDDAPITDGHFWVKMITQIIVDPQFEGWNLQLYGLKNATLDFQTYLSAATCSHHRTTYEQDGHVYEGIPLWIIVSIIDDFNTTSLHNTFNTSLAEKGYIVKVVSEDGHYVNLTSHELAFNNSIVVAYKVDGQYLSPADWPLKLVGPIGDRIISQIVSIWLLDWQ